MSSVRRTIMEASVKLSSDPDITYIRTLEHMERRLLAVFVRMEASSSDRAVLARHIARLRLLHLDMTNLGGATGR